MTAEFITLKFIGGQEAPISFTVNDHKYQGAKSEEYLYLSVPAGDAEALVETGYWGYVKDKNPKEAPKTRAKGKSKA